MTTKKLPIPLIKDEPERQHSLFNAKGKIQQAVDFLNEYYIIHIPVHDPSKVTIECKDKNRYAVSPSIGDIHLHFIDECEISISKSILKDIIYSPNYIKPFDPIKNYINSIRGKYEGISHIDLLCSFLKFREFDPENPTYSTDRANRIIKKWFVSTVAQWLDNIPNEVMLTFIQADEGYGKTKLVNYIIPKALERYIVKASNDSTKFDIEDAYTRYAFINHDELLGINKGTIETWKSIMTAKKLLTKRRFEDVAVERQRIGVALATTNKNQENGGFIRIDDKNTYGFRRFGCMEVEYINWKEYVKVVDCDQLWAEALMLYESSSFDWKFTQEIDFTEFKSYNEKYIVETVSIRYVRLYLSHPTEGEKGDMMNATEIIQDLRKHNKIRREDLDSLNVKNLGMALTYCGFDRKSNRKDGENPIIRYHIKRMYINNL